MAPKMVIASNLLTSPKIRKMRIANPNQGHSHLPRDFLPCINILVIIEMKILVLIR